MSNIVSLPTPSRTRRLTKRGATTRDKILESTITCIVRMGYTATSIEDVLIQSGLSRGSVLHQFPNRVALMVATAEKAMQRVITITRSRTDAIVDPVERLCDYARIMWETQLEAESLALTDILLAARWDQEVEAELRLVTAKVEQEVHDEFLRLARDAGIKDAIALVPHGWLLLASVRGLIIEYRINPARPMIVEAIDCMIERHRRFCARLLADSSAQSDNENDI